MWRQHDFCDVLDFKYQAYLKGGTLLSYCLGYQKGHLMMTFVPISDWPVYCGWPISFHKYYTWSLLELSFISTRIWVRSWLFCIQKSPFLVRFWCMVRVGEDLWTKNILYQFIQGHTYFSTSWHAKMSMLSPSMHWRLTKHGKCCVQNNQLPIKSQMN